MKKSWRSGLIGAVIAAFLGTFSSGAWAATCMYINSYGPGYDWSDGIEKSVEEGLKGHCGLIKFWMDSKRHPEKDFVQKKALEAKEIIDRKKPDVVIVSDDNAVKYILMPFYKNSKIPFVFCGVNWTAEAYGLPYKNATGMLEVSPIAPIASEIRTALKGGKTGVFLSADNESERMDYEYSRRIFSNNDIALKGVFVKTFDAWKKAYLEAQNEGDFLYLNNYFGINDFNPKEAEKFVHEHAKELTVTNYIWMMPFAMFGMMKQPSEQGEFSVRTALQIMGGASPSSIPIWSNKRYDPYINPAMLNQSPVKLGPHLLETARKWSG